MSCDPKIKIKSALLIILYIYNIDHWKIRPTHTNCHRNGAVVVTVAEAEAVVESVHSNTIAKVAVAEAVAAIQQQYNSNSNSAECDVNGGN